MSESETRILIEKKTEQLWEMERQRLLAYGDELEGKCFADEWGRYGRIYTRVVSFDVKGGHIRCVHFIIDLPDKECHSSERYNAMAFSLDSNLKTKNRRPENLGHTAREISEKEFMSGLAAYEDMVNHLKGLLK